MDSRPTSSSSPSINIQSSPWSHETKWHMELGFEGLTTGEKRYRPGWLHILKELFPSPMFSIAPWSYQEASRAGADHEVDIACVSLIKTQRPREGERSRGGRPLLLVEQKDPKYIKSDRHRILAETQIKERSRFGFISRTYIEKISNLNALYRKIGRIYALSAYGWRFARYAMDLDTGLTYPTSRQPPLLRNWSHTALDAEGRTALVAIRDKLIMAADAAGIDTGIVLPPMKFDICVPTYGSDPGELPPQNTDISAPAIREVLDWNMPEEDTDGSDGRDDDDSDYEDLIDGLSILSPGSTSLSTPLQSPSSATGRSGDTQAGGRTRYQYSPESFGRSASGSGRSQPRIQDSCSDDENSSTNATPPSQPGGSALPSTPPNRPTSTYGRRSDSPDEREPQTPRAPRYHNAGRFEVSPTERLSSPGARSAAYDRRRDSGRGPRA